MRRDDDRSAVAREIDDLDSLWSFEGPAESEARFRALLVRAEELHAGRESVDVVRTQIARALSLQRRFDEAHALLDLIQHREDQVDSLVARDARTAVRYLLERGRTLNSAGSRDLALPLLERAWTVARQAGLDALGVDAAHMAAIASSDSDAALAGNEQAMALAETSAEPSARAWRGSLQNNLGWTRHDRGEFGLARRHFEAALECRREQGDLAGILIARWCVARCLRSMARIDDALTIQWELLAEHERRGSRDGFVHEEIGECLAAQGRHMDARPHFRKAFEALPLAPGLSQREPDRSIAPPRGARNE